MVQPDCPVPQCFPVRVFLDIETLWSQIYTDLNRRGKQQVELTKTFNHLPFAWESWSYFKFKLSERLGIPVRHLTNRFFLHRLTHDMKRTKFAVWEDVDVMRFSDESQLVLLRSVLGVTICYVILASRAKLADKDPRQIQPGCAVNCVTAQDDDSDDEDGFIRVPSACHGDFDLIHNGNNILSLRIRYRKQNGRRRKHSTCRMPSSSTLPRHPQASELGILGKSKCHYQDWISIRSRPAALLGDSCL
jgi:hypothetical protein